MNTVTAWINGELHGLEETGLLRDDFARENTGSKFTSPLGDILSFASNDYLDLSKNGSIKAAVLEALDFYGIGGTSSRLLSGTTPIHHELEEQLAHFLGFERSLVFSSGFLANEGLLSCLCSRHDLCISDKLIHASLVQGVLLSRAEHKRFHHNDVEHLQSILKSARASGKSRKIFVVVESLYSMDGDCAPLEDLIPLCEIYDAMLVIDEAHAVGVFGERANGCLPMQSDRERLVVTGNFSKAFGCYGGFVACSERMRRFLCSRSRAFIYNTGLPPCLAAGAQKALELVQANPHWGKELLHRASEFRKSISGLGLDTMSSESQIVPLRIDDGDRALQISQELWEARILAPAIRRPTVPPGGERLRLSLTLGHENQDLAYLLRSIGDCRELFQGSK